MMNWEVVIRIVIAMAIGGFVGLQREFKNNSAGFRTHILVSLGACIAMITNEMLVNDYAGISNVDISRMGSYVISGIGFLGAGSIIKDNVRIRGLTTAAGLWVVACLGICVGAGYYVASVIGTLMVIFVLTLLKSFERRFFLKSSNVEIKIVTANSAEDVAKILCEIGALRINVIEITTNEVDENKLEIGLLAEVRWKTKIVNINRQLSKMNNFQLKSVKSA